MPAASEVRRAARTNVVLNIGGDISLDFPAYGGAFDSTISDDLARNGVLFANAWPVARSCSPPASAC